MVVVEVVEVVPHLVYLECSNYAGVHGAVQNISLAQSILSLLLHHMIHAFL